MPPVGGYVLEDPPRFLALAVLKKALEDVRSRNAVCQVAARRWIFSGDDWLVFWCDVAETDDGAYRDMAQRVQRGEVKLGRW